MRCHMIHFGLGLGAACVVGAAFLWPGPLLGTAIWLGLTALIALLCVGHNG